MPQTSLKLIRQHVPHGNKYRLAYFINLIWCRCFTDEKWCLDFSAEVSNDMFSYYVAFKQDNHLLWGVWSGDIRPTDSCRGGSELSKPHYWTGLALPFSNKSSDIIQIKLHTEKPNCCHIVNFCMKSCRSVWEWKMGLNLQFVLVGLEWTHTVFLSNCFCESVCSFYREK